MKVVGTFSGHVALALMIISIVLPYRADAIKDGSVLALNSGGAQWQPGDLVLVKVPSLTKQTLLAGTCGGPCFSPDGQKVAVTLNSEIVIVNIDGTNLVHTGITINMSGPVCSGAGYIGQTALYWLKISNVEYIYWFDQNLPGASRAKVGVWTREKLNSTAYYFGGFSQDGTRAAAVEPCWHVTAIDVTNWSARNIQPNEDGCNVSISPDGQYVWNLLNGGGQYGGGQHQKSIIRRWDNAAEVKVIDSKCNHDTNRWSHYDNNILLYRHYNQGNNSACDNTATFGVVMDLTTDERFNIGNNLIPFDFYPGTVTPPLQQVGQVDFAPTTGMKNEGALPVTLSTATSGATIRYTTDGSTPTTTAGTLINQSSGSTTITIVAGDTVTIKALAYKTGMTTSIVTTAKYYGPVPPPFTITSPKKGDIYHVGDSLHVVWTTRTGHAVRSDLNITVNDGLLYQGMLTASIYPTSPQWQNVAWKIPATLTSTTTTNMVSDSCRVQVAEYGNYDQYAESGMFSIKPRTVRVENDALANVPGSIKASSSGMIRIPLDSRKGGAWMINIFASNGKLIYQSNGTSPASEIVWQGINSIGRQMPGGIYCVVIRQGDTSKNLTIMLSKQ
jgi:uncharacterized protein YegP (UPF0339 family)